jgi:hypothetical protein
VVTDDVRMQNIQYQSFLLNFPLALRLATTWAGE